MIHFRKFKTKSTTILLNQINIVSIVIEHRNLEKKLVKLSGPLTKSNLINLFIVQYNTGIVCHIQFGLGQWFSNFLVLLFAKPTW